MSRVLVTGANGFIGSHVVEGLLARNHEVVALCEYNSFGSFGWLETLEDTALSKVLGDIRDPGSLAKLPGQFDAVLHLAALIAIPYSYVEPLAYIQTNIVGTYNVLEFARMNEIPRVVVTSTSEVYGTPDSVPIDVGHRLRAQSPYAATKIASDKLAEAWFCSFKLPVLCLRPFNTYGPRQSLRAIIPTVISQLVRGPHVEVGNLAPLRDFTFVTDTADGFVRAVEVDWSPGQTVQMGTGVTVSVEDIIRTCGEILNVAPEIHVDKSRVRSTSSEVDILLADPSTANSVLGWQADVSLKDGLAKTISWFKDNVPEVKSVRYVT